MTSQARKRTCFLKHLVLTVFLWVGVQAQGMAADLNLAVHPILNEAKLRAVYQPLADYIASVTGKSVELKTSFDYADYWYRMQDGKEFNLILDSAFFTDYRIGQQGFIPLAKFPGLVSYSLVTLMEDPAIDTDELVGKRIASLNAPAPAGLYLTSMFQNPTRQPFIVAARDSAHCLKLLLDKKVDGAMIPTPIVNQAMIQGADLNTVATSEQFPHNTLSVAPSVDEKTRNAIQQALLDAKNTPAGKALLDKLGFPEFEKANPNLFSGLARYLAEAGLVR